MLYWFSFACITTTLFKQLCFYVTVISLITNIDIDIMIPGRAIFQPVKSLIFVPV